MATHPSVLAWRIPGSGEPVGLPSMGSQSRTRLTRQQQQQQQHACIIHNSFHKISLFFMCSIMHRYANCFFKEIVLLAWNFFYPICFPKSGQTNTWCVCWSITVQLRLAFLESQNPFQHSSSPVSQSIRVTWEIKNIFAIPGIDNYRNNILEFILYIHLCLVHLLTCGCVSMKSCFL